MPNTYLSRTPASTGNRRIWTFSGWYKKSSFTNRQGLFGTDQTGGGFGTGGFGFRFNGTSGEITTFAEGAVTMNLVSNRLLRDTSAWYHVVLAVDTTQATSSDRIKIYVNGVQETSFSTATYPPQNFDFRWNVTSAPQYIGAYDDGGVTYFYDGLMASIYSIDGQALTPSSFGETDATTGIWKPKAYTGSYGTNGFFLKFENSGSLGTDSSGNGNNFTVNGTPTQTLDTPSNVFATLNPLDKSPTITLSNGNLTSVMGGGGFYDVKSTLGMEANSGKWYFEAKSPSISSGGVLGVVLMEKDGSNHGAVDAGRIVYQNNGNIYREGLGLSAVTGYATWTTGDVMSLALDTTTAGQNLKFYKNNTLIHTETNSAFSSNTWCFYVAGNGVTWDINYGNGYFGSTAISSPYSDGAGLGKFQYQPPTGYYALCTKNINVYG